MTNKNIWVASFITRVNDRNIIAVRWITTCHGEQ